MMTATDVRDKRRWSLAKTLFEATSLGGVWHLLTEEQREHWYHAAAAKDEFETVDLLLWQVTVAFRGDRNSVTFYLDAGVQGVHHELAAQQFVADRFHGVKSCKIMAIHYDLLRPRTDAPTIDQI